MSRLAAFLPRWFVDRARIYRNVGPDARRAFVRLQLRRALGLRDDRLPDVPSGGSPAALFVCYGNIIRSPMGEALLRRALEARGGTRWRVASAGVHARAGKRADPRGVTLAPEFGVSLEAHQAQPLTDALIDGSAVIFVMDWRNEAELVARFPRAEAKVVLLGAFGRAAGASRVITDPYDEDIEAVRRAYREVDAAVRAVAPRLEE